MSEEGRRAAGRSSRSGLGRRARSRDRSDDRRRADPAGADPRAQGWLALRIEASARRPQRPAAPRPERDRGDGPVIAALQPSTTGSRRCRHDRARQGTLSVTMIEGGTGGNVIPASCTIVASRRIVPGEDSTEVFHQLAGSPPRRARCRPGSSRSIRPTSTARSDRTPSTNRPTRRSPDRWPTGRARPRTSPRSARTPFATPTSPTRWWCSAPARSTTPTRRPNRVAIADLVALAEVYTRWLSPA